MVPRLVLPLLGLSRTPWLGPCALGSALVGLWCLYSVPHGWAVGGCEEAMLPNMAGALVPSMAPAFVSLSMSLSRGATPFFLWVWGNELCYDLSQVWSAFELC